MADNKKNIAQSPFFQFMGLLGDVVLLNLAWLIGCLPLVTIGASTCAAFSVAGKMAADESYSVFADYRAAFKRDWKQATLLWLAFAAVGAVIVAGKFRLPRRRADRRGGGIRRLLDLRVWRQLCGLGALYLPEDLCCVQGRCRPVCDQPVRSTQMAGYRTCGTTAAGAGTCALLLPAAAVVLARRRCGHHGVQLCAAPGLCPAGGQRKRQIKRGKRHAIL